MLAHSCFTKNGRQITRVQYGPRASLESLSDSVWNGLAVDAAADGGMVPGTAQTRVEDKFLYFAYQTVRSKNAADKIHREFTLEGRGATEDDAKTAAARSAVKVIAHLSAIGETAQTVGHSRLVTITNTGDEVSTQYCVYQCMADDGWTVIATDYGIAKLDACAAARATANTIANDHGGATCCTEIEPKCLP
jgi:hypothetical protein